MPEKDRFHRVLELDEDDFRYDAEYPDAATPSTDDFVLIEILLSVGRSVKAKKGILADLIDRLKRDPGIHPENVFVVFKETQRENWAFAGVPAGGRFTPDATNLQLPASAPTPNGRRGAWILGLHQAAALDRRPRV